MKWNCIYCRKENDDYPYLIKMRKYCSTRCQMNYEYKTGKRDKVKIGMKARESLKKKGYAHLQTKESRDNLRKVMQTKEYKDKARNAKLGSKNPMFGVIPWNKMFPTKKWFEEKEFVRLRKLCLERDNYLCVVCGVNHIIKFLYCDHKIPYRICKEHTLGNLQMMCGSCHSKKTVKDVKLMKELGYI